MALSPQPVFFDTSVLLAGIIDFGEQSVAALEILGQIAERRLEDIHTAWHCCLEIYSVATRLPVEYRLSTDLASQLVETEIQARFQIHGLPAAGRKGFFDSAAGEGVQGGRVYDFHIAETARTSGARIVATENRRHFTSLLRYGIRVLTAAELLDELRT